MSHYDYELSKKISARDEPFDALLFALMRRADNVNTEKLKRMWPDEWEELQQRYFAPYGILEGDNDV